jgi:DNA invertase Pin-like site-specific DNA recombinase
MRKNYGYCRVSTQGQDVEKQKYSLLSYGFENNISFEEIIEVVQSSRKSTKEREIDKLINIADKGDKVFITRLDRLGRNTREFLNIVELLKNKGITLHIIKENMIIDPNKNDPMTNLFLLLISSFSQLEREWISQRTIAGLEKAKAEGKMLGKPKGAISDNTQFEEHKQKIYEYIKLGLSYEKIVKIIGVGSKSSLYSFVQHRKHLHN